MRGLAASGAPAAGWYACCLPFQLMASSCRRSCYPVGFYIYSHLLARPSPLFEGLGCYRYVLVGFSFLLLVACILLGLGARHSHKNVLQYVFGVRVAHILRCASVVVQNLCNIYSMNGSLSACVPFYVAIRCTRRVTVKLPLVVVGKGLAGFKLRLCTSVCLCFWPSQGFVCVDVLFR